MGLINKIMFAPVNGKQMSGYSFLYQKVYDEIIGESSKPKPSEGLAFNRGTVTGIGSCTDTDIVIPSTTPSGYAVVTIGENALAVSWSSVSPITSIIIPYGVTKIERWAFANLKNLASIDIPNSVVSILPMAFQNCSKLTNIKIPNSVTELGGSAFISCSGLTSVTIGNGITSIKSETFSVCKSLTSITIPDSVTSIGYSAFEGCSSLTGVTIPKSVTNIDTKAFAGCGQLESIVYTGTIEQWKSLEKYNGDDYYGYPAPWDLDTGNYTVHCTDGDITK